jgi:hypothetical protein
MSLTVSLQCPHCGHSAQTKRVIPPGARIRCPQCRDVFHILPAAGGLIETIPVVGELERATALDLLAPEAPAPSIPPAARWNTADTGVPMPARCPPAVPQTETKALVSGKPLPFHRFRTILAAAGIALLVAAGYGFVKWYVGTVRQLDRTVTEAVEERSEELKTLARPKVTAKPPAPRSSNPPPPLGPKTAPSDQWRTVAPTASQIGDLSVAVSAAHGGPITEPVQGDFLTVTLRITNISKIPISYVSWSGPEMGVLLRVENGAFYNPVPLPKREPKSISPNETITDMLVFEPVPAMKSLELDLPIPGGDKSFRFIISYTLVDRTVRPAPSVVAEKPKPPPLDPEKDPAVRAAVVREYEKGAKDIKARSLGMATNEGTRFRRIKGRELVKKLAEKNQLEVEQVRRILGLN